MIMSDKLYSNLTNSLPVAGGGFAAFTQIDNIFKYFPAVETVTSTIIITIIGATVGYLIKLLLDTIFKKK